MPIAPMAAAAILWYSRRRLCKARVAEVALWQEKRRAAISVMRGEFYSCKTLPWRANLAPAWRQLLDQHHDGTDGAASRWLGRDRRSWRPALVPVCPQKGGSIGVDGSGPARPLLDRAAVAERACCSWVPGSGRVATISSSGCRSRPDTQRSNRPWAWPREKDPGPVSASAGGTSGSMLGFCRGSSGRHGRQAFPQGVVVDLQHRADAS